MKPEDGDISSRELLARLDERTERLDRDIRQMLNGQQAQYDILEARLAEDIRKVRHQLKSTEVVVNNNMRRAEANMELVKKHDEWFTWAVRLILMGVIGGVLVSIGIGVG